MSVLSSPRRRLSRTRVCVRAGAAAVTDEAVWKSWCSSMVYGGVGLIMVDGNGDDVDLRLSAARQVIGSKLAGVMEPVDPQARADVIHLDSVDHVDAWPGRLVGLTVETIDEAYEAYESGCAYLVTEARLPLLTGHMVDMARAHPDMVWFLAGCEDRAGLRQAIGQGARRVWIDNGDRALIAQCSADLRRAWSADPDMSALRRGQTSWR